MNFTYEGGELEIHGDVGTVIDMAPAAVTHIMPGAHRQRIPPVTDQLPAIVETAALTTLTDTYIVPALIAAAGDQAGWRYIEFFTANIRNPHTRRAYARACSRFFAWCEDRGQSLASIRPFDVATYIEGLQRSPPRFPSAIPSGAREFGSFLRSRVERVGGLPCQSFGPSRYREKGDA